MEKKRHTTFTDALRKGIPFKDLEISPDTTHYKHNHPTGPDEMFLVEQRWQIINKMRALCNMMRSAPLAFEERKRIFDSQYEELREQLKSLTQRT